VPTAADPSVAPPGWYADPWRQASWRWWDGSAWTGWTDAHYPAPAPSGPRLGPDGRPEVRAGGIAALGFLAGIVLAVVLTLPFAVAGVALTSPWLVLASTLGLWAGLTGACVVAVRRRGTGRLSDLGLARPRALDVGIGVAAGIGLVVAVAALTALISWALPDALPRGREDLVAPIREGGVAGAVIVALIAALGAPFFEELYFRGLLQGSLVARFGTRVGLVAQAVLFALVHLSPDAGTGNLGIAAVITLVGLTLGVLRRRTGRLGAGIVAHAVYNAILVGVLIATT
jgi:membrane protease YdiL (CAAX protease family)